MPIPYAAQPMTKPGPWISAATQKKKKKLSTENPWNNDNSSAASMAGLIKDLLYEYVMNWTSVTKKELIPWLTWLLFATCQSHLFWATPVSRRRSHINDKCYSLLLQFVEKLKKEFQQSANHFNYKLLLHALSIKEDGATLSMKHLLQLPSYFETFRSV